MVFERSICMDADPFPSTQRFERIRRIGQGCSGVVYEVYDRTRAQTVALKVLHACHDESMLLSRYTRIAATRCPHLVSLLGIYKSRARWFFTMELIQGVTFLEYVRPADRPWTQLKKAPGPPDQPVSVEPDALDVTRLRRGFYQLSEAVEALHRSGHVHGNIHASNVLVTHQGRVVLCEPKFDRSLRSAAGDWRRVSCLLQQVFERPDNPVTIVSRPRRPSGVKQCMRQATKQIG